MLDRLAIALARAARKGPFELTPAMLSLVGITEEQAGPILGDLGYRAGNGRDGTRFARAGRKQASARRPKRARDPSSPFAKLQELRKPA